VYTTITKIIYNVYSICRECTEGEGHADEVVVQEAEIVEQRQSEPTVFMVTFWVCGQPTVRDLTLWVIPIRQR